MNARRFDDYCRRKEEAATHACLPPYVTVRDRIRASPAGLDRQYVAVGNEWTSAHFDGPFYRTAIPPRDDRPIVNLVFVQSRDGNTVANDPSTLGGGDTDKHVIYEGLSRVDADAVLAGAATARSTELVFSVWHPELVALRLARGRQRHPAQVIVTATGALRWDDALLLNTPSLRVYLVSSPMGIRTMRPLLEERPWIDTIDAGEPLSMARAMRALRARGIETVSAVGGRRTAAALLQDGVVDDLYLTTSPIAAGEPDTPFYEGAAPRLTTVVEKAGTGVEEGVRFEYAVIRR